MDYNKVILVGDTTKDPESKYTPSGSNLAKCTLAINNNYKNKKEVYFFEFIIWGKLADVFCQYVHKGDKILIEGELRQERWEKDGQKHNKTVINVSSFLMLQNRGKDTMWSIGKKSNTAKTEEFIEEIDTDDLGVDEFDAEDMPF